MHRSAALRKAILSLGSMAALARALGIRPQAIFQWNDVPPRRVLAVERLTGVDRVELRPDIYDDRVSDIQQAPPAADAEPGARKPPSVNITKLITLGE